MGSIEEAIPDEEQAAVVKKPLGIRMVENLKKSTLSYNTCQAIVLIITFFTYTAYHLARKTTSVIKSVLDPANSSVRLNSDSTQLYSTSLRINNNNNNYYCYYYSSSSSISSGSGWAPFDGSNGSELLGYLDLAFLIMYATSQFLSGQIGDRVNLRVFLTVGMLATGFFTASFGFAYWLNIHSFYYFLAVQMLAGLFQSTGWPSVVAVVGNWFGKSRRGLIMGIWNAHTSVGNIAGSLIASNLLRYGWGWSMLVPGLIIAVMGLIVYVSLPVSPASVGLVSTEYEEEQQLMGKFLLLGSHHQQNQYRYDYDYSSSSVNEPFLESDITTTSTLPTGTANQNRNGTAAIGFCEALRIPGIVNYAMCLFFVKLVAYTFLYWLPFYISYTEIGGEYLSSEVSGNLSTLFDIGGVFGGILAGHVSDRLNARAITSATFTLLSIPALYLYKRYGYVSIYANGSLMFVAGMFVNGPYALITTAVSADLGTQRSLTQQSRRGLATVTAIIDGTGSIGAAIGPLLTGYISNISWNAVFVMLMASDMLAGILLTKLVWVEVTAKLHMRSRSISRSELQALH